MKTASTFHHWKINRRTTNVPFEVYSLRFSLVLKNLELKAVGAIPQFLKICAQKDISVQHLGSGIYVLPMYPDKLETKKGEKVFGCVGSNILYLFRHCSHLKPFIDVLLFITSYSLYTLYITHTSDNEKVKKGKKEKEPFQTAKKEKVSCQLTLYTLCTLTTLYTLHTAQIFYTLTNVFWI